MRKISFSEGEYYHLYNRGVDKRIIFTTMGEYDRFKAYLHMLNTTNKISPSDFFKSNYSKDAFTLNRENPLVAIGAYCLMPNHFHLYLTPLVEGGVSKFMQKLQTAYTMYFNKKHNRSGSLLQGTFKSEHVDNDRYAKYLFSYIHLNPAKLRDPFWKKKGARELKKLSAFVRSYAHSSLREYISNEHLITDPLNFPLYLHNQRDVDSHIAQWLQSNLLEV